MELDEEMSKKLKDCVIKVPDPDPDDQLTKDERKSMRYRVVDRSLGRVATYTQEEQEAEKDGDAAKMNLNRSLRVKLENELCTTYLPEVQERYEQQLLDGSGSATGFPVDLERVKAEWQHLNPGSEFPQVLIQPLGLAGEQSSGENVNLEGDGEVSIEDLAGKLVEATAPAAEPEEVDDETSEAGSSSSGTDSAGADSPDEMDDTKA